MKLQDSRVRKNAGQTGKDSQDVDALWATYAGTKSPVVRNRLMEAYLPLVKYNADRMAAKLPSQVELDDLQSAGVFGLKDAVEGFDPGRGIKFGTYCTMRIRGAMLDELRAMDWVPRLARRRSHAYRRAADVLEAELGRPPTETELARRLNISAEEFERLRADATTTMIMPLSSKPADGAEDGQERDLERLEDPNGREPEVESHKRDLKELITRGLTRAERMVLVLYYYEEMTMKEIGAVLDLSESRVSQMHASILERLRAQLAHRQKELVA